MSWLDYVTSMTASGRISEGALLGIDGSIWAQSEGFALTAEEAVALAGGMGEASGAYLKDNGCTIAGVKYFTLRMDPDEGILIGKKGASGVSVARSTQCLVVGVYSEGMAAGDANVAVQDTKDYLVSQSY